MITDEQKKAIETFLRGALDPKPLQYHSFETVRNPDRHPSAAKYITIITLFDPKSNKYHKIERNALLVLRTIQKIHRYGNQWTKSS